MKIKLLLLLSLSGSVLSQVPPEVSEQAIRTLLSPQVALHQKMAQAAAQAFGLEPKHVEVCLVLSEHGCSKKHQGKIVLHVGPQDLMLNPSLMRYNVFGEMYTEVQIRKYQTRAPRTLWQRLLNKTPELTDAQRKKALMSMGDVQKVDGAICAQLINSGHADAIILELMRVQAAEPALPEQFAVQLKKRAAAMEQALAEAGFTDIPAEMAAVEELYCEQIFAPQLQHVLEQQGPLGIAHFYRKLVWDKCQADIVAPWGMRLSSSIKKLKEFCQVHKIQLEPALKELAGQEIALLIREAHKTTNPSLHLKKATAMLKIAEQEGRDTELDGNVGIKLQLTALETALRKFPAN